MELTMERQLGQYRASSVSISRQRVKHDADSLRMASFDDEVPTAWMLAAMTRQ
jgi:hypothetical protein